MDIFTILAQGGVSAGLVVCLFYTIQYIIRRREGGNGGNGKSASCVLAQERFQPLREMIYRGAADSQECKRLQTEMAESLRGTTEMFRTRHENLALAMAHLAQIESQQASVLTELAKEIRELVVEIRSERKQRGGRAG